MHTRKELKRQKFVNVQPTCCLRVLCVVDANDDGVLAHDKDSRQSMNCGADCCEMTTLVSRSTCCKMDGEIRSKLYCNRGGLRRLANVGKRLVLCRREIGFRVSTACLARHMLQSNGYNVLYAICVWRDPNDSAFQQNRPVVYRYVLASTNNFVISHCSRAQVPDAPILDAVFSSIPYSMCSAQNTPTGSLALVLDTVSRNCASIRVFVYNVGAGDASTWLRDKSLSTIHSQFFSTKYLQK